VIRSQARRDLHPRKRSDVEHAPNRPAAAVTTAERRYAAQTVRSSRLLREVAGVVVFVALFLGLEWLSFLHEQGGYSVTPWNPGLGVAFAMIVYRGVPYAIALFVAVLLAEVFVFHSGLSWAVMLTLSGAVACSYSVAAIAARRWLSIDSPLDAGALVAMVIAGGIAAALDAMALSAVLYVSEAFDQLSGIVLPLFVGDAIGIAVFAPLTMRLIQHRRRPPARLQPGPVAEGTAYFVLIIVALVVALYPAEGWPRGMFYLLFLPVGVASIRFGVDGACASLAVAQLGLVAILHLHAFDFGQFFDYQVTMLVLTLTGLIVGGLSSARQAAEEDARRAARRIAELQAEATRVARFNIMSSMSAALAHEINQPFTAARALARAVEELLRKPEIDAARIRTNAAGLVAHIDTAGAIIHRMRAFLRRGEPHVSTVALQRLIDDSIALVRPLAASRQIELDVDLPVPQPQILHVDSVQIQQVIMNLMLNAIEAIAESHVRVGRVALRIERRAGEVEFAVTDNGPGIPLERASNLFEPLNTTRSGGMGLGLSICKSIIEAHGGRIWLHTGVAGLTEFRFTLPVEAAAVHE
jgi:signal transduction histidine kinase